MYLLIMMHIMGAYGTGPTHNDEDGLGALVAVRDDSDDVWLVVMPNHETCQATCIQKVKRSA